MFLTVFAYAYLVWNIIVFLMYGFDKSNARLNKRRVSEKTLILSALLMGGIGAYLSMYFFKHKTMKLEFKLFIPLFLLLNTTALIGLSYFYPELIKTEDNVMGKRITAEEAINMIDAGAVILDVRTKAEYDTGYIPGAILLPYDEIVEKADKVLPDKSKTILVYCLSGRRSANAADVLMGLGYEIVYDLGGITDWKGDIEKPKPN